MYVRGLAMLCVLCASCGMMETVPLSPRTLAIPLPVANEDQILLAVHDITARSAAFRAFYRAFWEHMPLPRAATLPSTSIVDSATKSRLD